MFLYRIAWHGQEAICDTCHTLALMMLAKVWAIHMKLGEVVVSVCGVNDTEKALSCKDIKDLNAQGRPSLDGGVIVGT